jgi:hypothetical protein
VVREDYSRLNLPLWAFLFLLAGAWIGAPHPSLELTLRFALLALPCAAVLYYGLRIYKANQLWTVVLSFFALESVVFVLFSRPIRLAPLWVWIALTIGETVLLALIVASFVPEKEERMAIPEK